MKNIVLIILLFLPTLALGDWRDDFKQKLIEEGYGKKRIAELLELEEKRRELDKAKKEKDNEDLEAQREKNREEDDEVDSEENKIVEEDSKSEREQWTEDYLEKWSEVLIENEWQDKELLRRQKRYRVLLRGKYGKSDEEVEKAYQTFLKKEGRSACHAALRSKSYSSVKDKVRDKYAEYINLPKKQRVKTITKMYFDLLEEDREDRVKVLDSARKTAMSELKDYWDDKKFNRREVAQKERAIGGIFDSMSTCLTKKEYNSKLSKVTSKKDLATKEKKIIKAALKEATPSK